MENLAGIRKWFADELRFGVPVHSQIVIDAFATVPRENFLGPAPWTLITNDERQTVTDPAALYHDVLVTLDSAKGINNGKPSVWAAAFDALNLAKGETVLHAGAGAGYYSAILAECVGPQGKVTAAEIDPELAARARRNLTPWPNVTVENGDAASLPQMPVDAIVVSAGLNTIPMHWICSLKPGARLVLPLSAQGAGRRGAMLVVERQSGTDRFAARFISIVSFIGFTGPHNEAAEQALAAALSRHDLMQVRSLKLGAEPDKICWLKGDGWWLSTAPP